MAPDQDEACRACGDKTVVRPMPAGCQGVLSTDPALVRVCQRCLTVTPADGSPAERDWDPDAVSPALPSDPDAAVGVALLVSLLDSLALHRAEIERVVDYLEVDAGVDPLLAVQRIAASETLDPAVDLERREQQLAQILGDDR